MGTVFLKEEKLIEPDYKDSDKYELKEVEREIFYSTMEGFEHKEVRPLDFSDFKPKWDKEHIEQAKELFYLYNYIL